MLIYPNAVFTSTLSLIILKYYYSEYLLMLEMSQYMILPAVILSQKKYWIHLLMILLPNGLSTLPLNECVKKSL